LIQEKSAKPLAQEGALLEMLLREPIENETVEVIHVSEDVARYADRRAQRSLCHLVNVSTSRVEVVPEFAVSSALIVPGPRPEIRISYEAPTELPADDAVECWTLTLERLLRVWI